jgi:hypothetical protein
MKRRNFILLTVIIFAISQFPVFSSAAEKNKTCLDLLADNMADNALKFYRTRVKDGKWNQWGINENEKQLKIWILPPIVEKERGLEIIGKSKKSMARFRLMKMIENSFGANLEEVKGPSETIRIIANSKQTVNNLVKLISEKYSSNIFNPKYRREIGKMTSANILMQITLIPGDAPVISAHFMTVETGIKFGFSGNVQLVPENCRSGVKEQVKILSGQHRRTVIAHNNNAGKVIIDYLPCTHYNGESNAFTQQIMSRLLAFLDNTPTENNTTSRSPMEIQLIKLSGQINAKLKANIRTGQKIESERVWLHWNRRNPNHMLMICQLDEQKDKITLTLRLLAHNGKSSEHFYAQWKK